MATAIKLVLLATLAACSVSDAKSVSYDVYAEIASVTLADNCINVATPPATRPAPKQAKPVDIDENGEAPPSARRQCEQTSMQLAFTARAGVKPTSIKIKQVELLDMKGNVVQVLKAFSPTQWTPKGVYLPWNETITAGSDAATEIKASYLLSAPDWAKLTNGRANAQSHTFQLRVTVTIGNANRTVEKTSITPARVQPRILT